MKFGLPSFNKLNKDTIRKGLNYLKFNGVDGVMSQVRYKMAGPGLAYNNWYKEKHEADAEELAQQRNTHFAYEPVISIVVPIYMTPEFFLRSMIESVMRQSYVKWELCIVDGSQADKIEHEINENDSEDYVTRVDGKKVNERNVYSDNVHNGEKDISKDNNTLDNTQKVSVYEKLYSMETEKIVRQYMEHDDRIKYHLMRDNLGISDNTNTAIDMSSGEYIAFLEHDDILTDDALFRVVEALQERKYTLLYSDEDKMSEDGSKYSDPAFKPDFSIDLIRSYNYIHRFLVVNKSFALAVGCLRREYDGAQSYDFILRCIEKNADVKHISRVLYHYRINSRSTSAHTHKIEYKWEMEKKALASHIRSCGMYATVSDTKVGGIYRVNYETPGNPYISIIIPGGNDWELLNRCLQPLFELARYSNFEIIIVDQDGTDDTMLKYYHKMERIRRNISVVVDKEDDNLPSLRNFGAARAKGEYLLFLDANVEIVEPAAIGDMLGRCMLKDAGVVSGTLYNDNNTVYHQGYVIGVNGIYNSVYKGLRAGTPGYLMHNLMNRDLSAVSSSCMMIKRSLFRDYGGFDENLKNELAEIDLCLKIRQEGKLVVCMPVATWYYHRSYKYGLDKGSNLEAEEEFKSKWSEILEKGDPYYNINFARDGEMFSLE